MNKKQKLKLFQDMVEGFELELNKRFYDYKIETEVGSYYFSNPDCGGSIGAIFGRFEEPKRAFPVYHCNRYNGKYNFFGADFEKLLIQFKKFLTNATNKG